MRTTFGVYRAAATAASSARRRYPSVAAPTGPTIRTTLGAALAANAEPGMSDPAMASATRVTTTMTEPRFIERSTPHRPRRTQHREAAIPDHTRAALSARLLFIDLRCTGSPRLSKRPTGRPRPRHKVVRGRARRSSVGRRRREGQIGQAKVSFARPRSAARGDGQLRQATASTSIVGRPMVARFVITTVWVLFVRDLENRRTR